MAINSQEQFEKVKAALKAGQFSEDQELQSELISQAQDWKVEQIGAETSEPIPQGGSLADALGQGTFFGFSDELAGLAGATIGTFDRGLQGTTFAERFRGIRDAARANAQAFATRNPGTSLAATIAGGVLTGGAGAARAGAFQAAKNAPTLAGRLAPIAKTGAVQGGLFGAGASEADSARGIALDTLKGAAIGAATAPVLPFLAGGTRSVVSRVAQAKDSKPFRDAIKLLKDKVPGLKLTTGQKTGSDPLRSTETTLADTFLGSSINRALDTNRRKVQGALFKMAGFADDDVSSGLLTRESLDRAADRFARRYRNLVKNAHVELDSDDFLNSIAAVEAKNLSLIPPIQRKQVNQIVDSFLDVAIKGPMNGRTYQSTRSRLGKLAQQSKVSNPFVSDLYRGLKQSLDDAFFAGGGNKAGRKVLDQEYGRYKQLLGVFETSGSQQISEGFMPLSMILRRAAKQPDREFERVVRAAQSVLGDPVANSGTPARLLNAGLLTGAAGSAAVGGLDAGALSLGIPLGTSLALSRGVTGSPVINKAIQSGLLTAPATVPLLGDFN